jgi:site-specific recombinase XerD
MTCIYQPEAQPGVQLYDKYNQRLYLNAAEHKRFIDAARSAAPDIRSFALTLVYTGCRLSEARALMGHCLQREARIIAIRSLKKRDRHVMREVPIPPKLVDELVARNAASDALFWSQGGQVLPRITAYRWIKTLMCEAGIEGAQACPKGLRHGYGVNATLSGVQLHMLQRWMGHASIRTTAIYATVLGPDQLKLADQMWT